MHTTKRTYFMITPKYHITVSATLYTFYFILLVLGKKKKKKHQTFRMTFALKNPNSTKNCDFIWGSGSNFIFQKNGPLK